MTLTVIEHMPSVPLDRFADWLVEPGGDGHDPLDLVVVRPWAGDPIPSVEQVGAGLLVLGGQGSALDDEGTPWLPQTRDLLAAAARSGVPTLGICLGAQLLALATGGRVQVAAPPGREAGVIEVHPRPEAKADALLGALAADVPADHPLSGGVLAVMPSMHADAVVDLPSGAVWLASSHLYPYQAFKIGSAWGVQFHPEVGQETFTAWADLHDDVDTEVVVAAFRANATEIERGGRAIAHAYAAIVRERVAVAV